MIYRKVRGGRANGRHPDRARRGPLDHLAVGDGHRGGAGAQADRHRPLRRARGHRERRLGRALGPRDADAPPDRVRCRARPELRAGRAARLLALEGRVRVDARAGNALAPDDRDRGARRGRRHRGRHRPGARRARPDLPLARHRRDRSRARARHRHARARAACSRARCCARSARSSAGSTSRAWTSSRSRRRTTTPRHDGDGREPRGPRGDQRPRREEGRRHSRSGGTGRRHDRNAAGGRRRPEPRLDALARLYDVDLEEDPGDIDLYLALANRNGGPVLEIAVGSGRIALPLAEAGHDVTGIDLDPGMLRRARRSGRGRRPRDRRPDPSGRGRRARRSAFHRREPSGSRSSRFNSLLVFGDRRDQARAMATMAAPSRAGRARRRRSLAPGRRPALALRRARGPRVRPPRPGQRARRDQDGIGPPRLERARRPDHDLRGERPGRAGRPLGARGPVAARWPRRAGRDGRGRGPARGAAGGRLRPARVRARRRTGDPARLAGRVLDPGGTPARPPGSGARPGQAVG